MRPENLLEAIGKVDDRLVEQAMEKKSVPYMRWLSIAASFLLVIGLCIFAFKNLDFVDGPVDSTAHTDIQITTGGIAPTEPSSPAGTEPTAGLFEPEYRVALITDYGDINDSSFNQASYEGAMQFATEYNIEFKYYKPTSNDTAGRVASTELAIAEGYNIIVMPGYAFGATIVEIAPLYPDIRFLGIDVAPGDLLETAVPMAGEAYDYNPHNWNLADYLDMSNVYCCIYQEELAGYMAGYAAVQLGYSGLGFLGGMAVPAVQRYGYGFVQGADAAAAELNTDVSIKFIYGGQFFGDADITSVMDSWYASGTEAIFACGGGIYTSVAESAVKFNGKVIGSDTDQSALIDGMYGMGMTVTSAMKGIAPTVYDTLTDIILNGAWDSYAGKIELLGLEAHVNYLALPMESTQWNEGFTQEDYLVLLQDMTSGKVTVSDDISQDPITLRAETQYLGNIKG